MLSTPHLLKYSLILVMAPKVSDDTLLLSGLPLVGVVTMLLKHPPRTVMASPIRPFTAPVRLEPHSLTSDLHATELLRVRGTLERRQQCIVLMLKLPIRLLVQTMPLWDPDTPLLLKSSYGRLHIRPGRGLLRVTSTTG